MNSSRQNCQSLHASDYDFNDVLLPIGATFQTELLQVRMSLGRGEPE